MSPLVNSLLGFLFLAVGAAATFLMFYLWGFPYDKEKHHSFAPPRLVLLHRVLGFAYLLLYVFFLVQMLPRLWNYQIEFPARTVVHFTLGMAIGVILVIKLAIVRWFRHMEAKLIPFLGTSLLICTALLIGLSVPFALRERYLQGAVLSGERLDPASLERVIKLLSAAGFKEKAEVERLVSPVGLSRGQDVLTRKCIVCHDLRTVLARPQTPENWRVIVQRMAVRSTLFDTISDDEQSHVTAYLVAISPQLQQSAREQRTQERRAEKTLDAVHQAADLLVKVRSTSTPADASRLFQSKCSQCHDLKQVDNAPPHSAEEVRTLVSRMVDQGLSGTADELAAIMWHLQTQYVH
jgi:cytochrome c5